MRALGCMFTRCADRRLVLWRAQGLTWPASTRLGRTVRGMHLLAPQRPFKPALAYQAQIQP